MQKHQLSSSMEKHKLISRRALAAFAVVVLLAALTATAAAHASSARDRRHDVAHELERKRLAITAAKSKEQALAGAIARQSDQIQALQARVATLDQRVAGLERQLAEARERLAHLEAQLAQEKKRLTLLRREVATAQQVLEERLVEIYTSGTPGALEIILGATTLEELIDRIEVADRVVAQDSLLLAQVSEAKERTARAARKAEQLRARQESVTAALDTQAAAQRAALATLVAERDALAAARAVRQRSLDSMEVQREQWEAQADALDAESAQLSRIIASAPPPLAPTDAAPATAPRSSTPTTPPATATTGAAAPAPPAPSPAPPAIPSAPAPSQGFVWPVRGPVVSPYGQRWGRLHAGVDIAAPAGTPIVASAAGRVIYAGSMSGYGLLVVIQHAGGIATAYAHNSRNAVSVGQSVSQGQLIGYVGCTGSCFGDHVHFEVRVNGSPVDPMRYL